jgi:hypothetical protein
MHIEDEYFEWMYGLICNEDSYRRILEYLHGVEFISHMRGDGDRAYDGRSLRRRFALSHDDYDYDYVMEQLHGPCSVLEMMIALAFRCEENIMHDTRYGDRTAQWFWRMMVSLGLGSMTNSRYDDRYVEEVITTFLNHKYEPNGRGGLFTIRDCNHDLRKFTIWKQAMWYLDTMI